MALDSYTSTGRGEGDGEGRGGRDPGVDDSQVPGSHRGDRMTAGREHTEKSASFHRSLQKLRAAVGTRIR